MGEAQRKEALQKANHIRETRSRVKRALANQTMTLSEAIQLPECQTMPLYDLLRAQKHIGPYRASKALREAAIPLSRQIQNLSLNQRAAIANDS